MFLQIQIKISNEITPPENTSKIPFKPIPKLCDIGTCISNSKGVCEKCGFTIV